MDAVGQASNMMDTDDTEDQADKKVEKLRLVKFNPDQLGTWKKHVWSCLLPFLYNDLLPIVLSYVTIIEFTYMRSWGTFGKNWGTLGKKDGEMDRPYALCIDGEEIFVADTFNNCVQVFHDSNGRFLRSFDTTVVGTRPRELVIHNKEIIIVSGNKHNIVVHDKYEGKQLRYFIVPTVSSLSGLALFNNILYVGSQTYIRPSTLAGEPLSTIKLQNDMVTPRKICIDDTINEQPLLLFSASKKEQILAVDITTHQIVRTYDTKIGALYSGIVVHGDYLIATDITNHQLVMFNRVERTIIKTFGSKGCDQDRLNDPLDLAINNNNELFVVDNFNHRVVVYQ